MPPTVTTLFIGSIIFFLTASNVWAIESYSQKFGIECKGCHTSIPALNERGVTFKKNGHTVVEKSVRPDNKPGQSPIENKDKPLPVVPTSDVERPSNENKIYSWETGDGTPHFSDVPFEITPVDKIATANGRRKITKRVATRPLSAKLPAKLNNVVVKPVTPNPVKSAKSYEKCMEETLISFTDPTTAEIAMEQFLAAENRCLPFEKEQQHSR